MIYKFNTSNNKDSNNVLVKEWYQKYLPSSRIEWIVASISILLSGYFVYQWWRIKDDIAIKQAIDNEDYNQMINLLEKRVLNNRKTFSLQDSARLYMSYMQLLQYEKAEYLLLKMIEVLPEEEIATRFQLANLYLQQDQYGLAIQQLIQVIKQNPDIKISQRLFVETEIQKTYEKFFIKQNNEYTQQEKGYLCGCVGLLYFYLNFYKEAEQYQKQSLKYLPNQQSIQSQLANTLYVQDKLDESKDLLEKLYSSKNLKEKIKQETIHTLVGIYHTQNEDKKALQLCQKQDNEQFKKICIQILDNLKMSQIKENNQS